jgi:aspartyl-tRNA(Asn)/glutamyl-tRNA(Gln) amidotransferase subunit C
MKLDENKIKEESLKLLNKFASALEKAGFKEIDTFADREDFERGERNGENYDKKFKKRILENAPNSDENFIIAEKGSWK